MDILAFKEIFSFFMFQFLHVIINSAQMVILIYISLCIGDIFFVMCLEVESMNHKVIYIFKLTRD